jgi:4,5-dihydroxyphthalate decarboxylase
VSTSTITASLALSDNVRTKPLLTGEVTIDGVNLAATTLHPSEMFWRQLHFGDFDISEMSLASLLVLADQHGGDLVDWVALPVFTSRQFFHTAVVVRTDVGIENPADLAGHRVGVPEYQQTAAVWARGVLADRFGLDPATISWFMERTDHMSHGAGTGFTPPPGIRLEPIPPDESIGTLLTTGRLDAALRYLPAGNLVDRSKQDLNKDPQIRTLFPSPADEASAYYADTGVFPVNHAVVIRRSLAEQHPWLVLNVYNAFVRARRSALDTRDTYVREFRRPGDPSLSTDVDDLYPYGLKPNRDALATLARYAAEQGLTKTMLDPASLFSRRVADL